MNLTHGLYVRASNEVERIMRLPIDSDFEKEVLNAGMGIGQELLIDYYTHLNGVFLNAVLNRLYEFGEYGKRVGFLCRELIAVHINELMKTHSL